MEHLQWDAVGKKSSRRRIDGGRGEELCPMDIPLALFSHAIRVEADATYEPKLGPSAYKN
ncbi:MAG: hypothetical protein NTZ39_11050 [Methanoregula sp.]|nr:hypothetical protein [Methanoregula sp.]